MLLPKDQSLGIQAVSESGRWRTVGKDVSEMATATRATDFRANHAMTPIRDLKDILPRKGLEKAGPARAGVELSLGVE